MQRKRRGERRLGTYICHIHQSEEDLLKNAEEEVSRRPARGYRQVPGAVIDPDFTRFGGETGMPGKTLERFREMKGDR